MNAANEQVLTHKWQEQNLGTAPFQAVCILSLPSTELCEKNPSAYNLAMQDVGRAAANFGVNLGSCDSCGMPLMHNVVIRDTHGKHFVVGCDCAAKTHDTKLVSKVELLEKQRQRAIAEAKRQAEWDAKRAARLAEEQAQRDRNGGKTDFELRAEAAAKQAQEEEASLVARFGTENAWLIDALNAQGGDFARSVASDLRKKSTDALSDRCLDICGEIYAKQVGGRKGSKAYKAAYEFFSSKVWVEG